MGYSVGHWTAVMLVVFSLLRFNETLNSWLGLSWYMTRTQFLLFLILMALVLAGLPDGGDD